MPSGRLPDTLAQRRYKTLRKRLETFRAMYPEGYNRWIDNTIAGYERQLAKLDTEIRAEGRTVPSYPWHG